MDVLLFNPAPRSGWQAQRRVEVPLSLLSAATPLDLQGYRIRIIDQFADPNWKREFTDALKERPICFGVTCMTGPQILRALEACKVFRERHPNVPIVWGGIHASLLPQQTLENPLVDIVVVGEGEVTFEQLVKALQSGTPLSTVKGICYKEYNNGNNHGSESTRAIMPDGSLGLSVLGTNEKNEPATVISNGNYNIRWTGERPFVNLDEQPPLSYHLVNMNHYRRNLFEADVFSFNSSRGCTFRCSFCWDPVLHKRKWRAMQPKIVVDHLKRIIRDYDIRGFNFTDDHFFIDMKRAYGIMEEIVRANLKITIGKLHVRADSICRMDADFLKLLVRAGVKRLTIGVESGSQHILDLIKKDIYLEEVLEAARKLIPYPIVPVYLFMMGMPTETPDELVQSIRLAELLVDENPKAAKSFNVYTPYPGTELFHVALRHGLKPPVQLEDWARFNYRRVAEPAPWIPQETKKLIEGLDFPLMFMGKGHFVIPYKKTNPLVIGLAKLYHPIARYRIRHLNVRFPIETKVAKALGLFAKQD
jgi:anaerobic magnesium-protoporphyrin IX monomethyl ester cyclase